MKSLKVLTASLLLASSLIAMQDGMDASSHKEAVTAPKADLTNLPLCEDGKTPLTSGFQKVGFLTTKDCAEKGTFTSCNLESFVCGTEGCFKETEAGVITTDEMVLFVHDEGKYYKIDPSNMPRSQFDAGVSRNLVTIGGEYDSVGNTIIAKEFKAPPPPKKSFFKGCL